MKISKEKEEKICEQILAFIYSTSPKPLFTSHIAKEIARDEEFTKRILKGLKTKHLVTEINKNSEGKNYLRRSRWTLTDNAYRAYKQNQKTTY